MTITPAEKPEVVSEAVKNEEKLKSYFYVMDVDGQLKDPKTFDFKGHEKLKAFVDYEMAKKRAVDKVPPHVELMRRLELADYEPGSDPGNMRFYPKGRMMKACWRTTCSWRRRRKAPWKSRRPSCTTWSTRR